MANLLLFEIENAFDMIDKTSSVEIETKRVAHFKGKSIVGIYYINSTIDKV